MTTEHDDKKDEGSDCGCGAGACGGANKWIWIVLALAVLGVLFARGARKGSSSCGAGTCAIPQEMAAITPTGALATTTAASVLPRLVDLGATKCIPCKMMAPILEELKKTYVGKLDVQFIDVWENPDAGKKYGINVIPTQIFYGADGKELFRHEGFFAKEDILAKWQEFGVDWAK